MFTAISTMYFGLSLAASDLLALAILLVVVAEIDILRFRLQNVTKDAKEICSCKNYDFNRACQNVLKDCVELHLVILRYVSLLLPSLDIYLRVLGRVLDNINQMLSIPLLVQYGSVVLTLCGTALEISYMASTLN